MSIPSWFDPKAYFNNKLAATPGINNDLELTAAFNNAGFVGDEGLWNHYNAHGAAEGISPNALFNVQQYLFAKAGEYYKTSQVTQAQANALFQLIEDAGMTPWEHYQKHGWQEGLSPSNGFDTELYFAAKLAVMEGEDPDGNPWTIDSLKKVFADANLDPVTHYLEHGINESLGTSFLNQGSTGQSFNLTTGDDQIIGTSGNDYFYAKLGQLNTNDEIFGQGGYDTLQAVIGNSPDGIAIQPTIFGMEKVIFQAQTTGAGGGTNAVSGSANKVTIDAGNISGDILNPNGTVADHGMEFLQNLNSRASLVVEDVRVFSDEMTISWKNADAGLNVDYEVYFDNQYLATEGTRQTGTLELKLMDVKNAQLAGNPLTDQPFDSFAFNFVPTGGASAVITLTFREADRALYSGATADYDSLLQAFQNALADYVAANSQYADTFTITLGDSFTGVAGTSGTSDFWQSNLGELIVISTKGGTINAPATDTNVGWGVSSGRVPSTGGIAWGVEDASTASCPLIVTDIHLDNVGRVKWVGNADCLPDHAIFGSEAGDMIVGAMGDGGGIERFNVTVESGSWLSSLASTNNTLRLVQVQDGSKGQLFIGEQIAQDNLSGAQIDNLWGPSSWNVKPLLLSTDGLEDVKQFDASLLDGNANIGASITSASHAKYFAQLTPGQVSAPLGDFDYTFGNQADILNMDVNSGVASNNHFKMNINMGGGEDLVNFTYSGALTDNQLLNMRAKLLQLNQAGDVTSTNMDGQVNIDTGAGNDKVWSWGDGVVNVNAGADNDAVYVGQNAADQNAVFVVNGTSAIFVDPINGAQALDNDAAGSVAVITETALDVGNTVFVKVSYGDVESTLIALGTVTGTGSTANISFNTVDINHAIAQAVAGNFHLNNLFAVKEGSGYSLLIEALFNHDFSGGGEPEITFWEGTTAANATALASGTLDAAYGTAAPASLAFLELDVQGITDPATGLITLTATAGLDLSAGDSIVLNINGVNYSYTAPAGGLADDAAFVQAIVNATDADGNRLGDSYIIIDDGTTSDNTFSIASKSGSLNYAEYYTVDTATATADGSVRADGSDNEFTRSYNVVEGGLGNDTLVLNAAGAASVVGGANFIDMVKITGVFGDDVIVNFDSTFDKVNVNALLGNNLSTVAINNTLGTANSVSVQAETFTTVAGFIADATMSSAYSGTTAGQRSVVFAQDGDVYTVFQVITDASATLSASEVTLLGSITMADGGAIINADFFGI